EVDDATLPPPSPEYNPNRAAPTAVTALTGCRPRRVGSRSGSPSRPNRAEIRGWGRCGLTTQGSVCESVSVWSARLEADLDHNPLPRAIRLSLSYPTEFPIERLLRDAPRCRSTKQRLSRNRTKTIAGRPREQGA